MKSIAYFRFLLVLCCCSFAISGLTSDKAKLNTKEEKDNSLIGSVPANQIMDSILSNFLGLLPFMSSPLKFGDKSNEKFILAKLVNLGQGFQMATHNSLIGGANFRPSLETTQLHLQNTIEAFTAGHKDFALTRLKATTNLCLSCHAQIDVAGKFSFKTLLGQVDRSMFADEHEYAEFLYILQDLDKAMLHYKKNVAAQLQRMKSLSRIDPNILKFHNTYTRSILNSIKKILIITVKKKRDITLAQKYIAQIEKMKGMPVFLIKELDGYLAQINDLKKKNLPKEFKSADEINKFISQQLESMENIEDVSDELNLHLVYSSGLLQEYLYNHPASPLLPKILFWASISERQLSKSYFYSLADVYLKECIKKFPKDPYAKRCFKEYEDNLYFGYTGSGGTHLPPQEKKELETLRQMIK